MPNVSNRCATAFRERKGDVAVCLVFDLHNGTVEVAMGKYVIAWMLGVPISLLAVVYVVSHAACGR